MKKGQVFTLDVLIAIVIIIIGIAILFYLYPTKDTNYYNTERMSEDVISVLQETKLSDICVNPGNTTSHGCRCQHYNTVQQLVCDESLINKDADILSFMTELIETRRVPSNMIHDMIKEIFVEKGVIDEKRFGFAIIYTKPTNNLTERGYTYELYNTETP